MRPPAALIGWVMAAYVRLVAATCRVSGGATREQVVLAFWHEYNLAAAIASWRLRRGIHHVSFSTQTYRGEIMTAMLAALGAGSVPLPEPGDRAGSARLSLELAALGREGATPVVSPDGPTGPYRVAKPGALLVAREADLPIRCWAVAARPALRLGRRWDRHVVPLPFCRLRVIEAAPLEVPPRAPLKPLLAELQARLDAAAQKADGSHGSAG